MQTQSQKIIRIILLIILVIRFLYWLDLIVSWLIFTDFRMGGHPLNAVFLCLVILSITGVAINKSFGPIIATISSTLSILGMIIIIRIVNFDAFYFILLILDFLVIIAAILMLSFRTLSPMKYPQIGLQHQRRYCTNCGALMEGNFCPVCGKDLRR